MTQKICGFTAPPPRLRLLLSPYYSIVVVVFGVVLNGNGSCLVVVQARLHFLGFKIDGIGLRLLAIEGVHVQGLVGLFIILVPGCVRRLLALRVDGIEGPKLQTLAPRRISVGVEVTQPFIDLGLHVRRFILLVEPPDLAVVQVVKNLVSFSHLFLHIQFLLVQVARYDIFPKILLDLDPIQLLVQQHLFELLLPFLVFVRGLRFFRFLEAFRFQLLCVKSQLMSCHRLVLDVICQLYLVCAILGGLNQSRFLLGGQLFGVLALGRVGGCMFFV